MLNDNGTLFERECSHCIALHCKFYSPFFFRITKSFIVFLISDTTLKYRNTKGVKRKYRNIKGVKRKFSNMKGVK